ncbi:DUF488 family protein [Methylocystis sp. SC2]|uniref:DUF488 domain-containing protein n=1 Tax=Methylocystis sp. (strain SC2) TaxID=187303 RepID=UPI0035290E0D
MATLHAVRIAVLVDVRAIAISRKKGFSKTALKTRLNSEGIAYQHMNELGDPKPGREAARAGRIDEFRRIYSEHLRGADAQASLRKLTELALERSVCLLCFERDPKHCHRSIVSDHLIPMGFKPLDLYGDLPRRYDDFSPIRAHSHSDQSLAATE